MCRNMFGSLTLTPNWQVTSPKSRNSTDPNNSTLLHHSRMEYSQHRQCQICLVQFNENEALLNHIEEFRVSSQSLIPICLPCSLRIQARERQLLAELERCRMHTSQLYNIQSGNEGTGRLRTELNRPPTVMGGFLAEDDGFDEEANGCGVDEDESNEEDEGYGGDDGYDLLCPFEGCARAQAFTDRSNLVRHFQQRMWPSSSSGC